MWYDVTTLKYTQEVFYLIDKGIFTTRFKQLCKLKKKTQAEIAESLGISVNGLKHYMRKNNNAFPPVEYLDLMAKEFDVDIAYLIGEIDVPKHGMLTLFNTTGLRSKDQDIKLDSEFKQSLDSEISAPTTDIDRYVSKTYALDLITCDSKEYSQNFCFFMDFLANSNKIETLSNLVFTLLYDYFDGNIVIIKSKSGDLEYAYNTNPGDRKILRNQIVSLFEEIIDSEVERNYFRDSDIAKLMTQQLLAFIERNFFNIPRKKMLKIIDRRLEEIREIDDFSIVLGYSPEKILEGFLIKLAEFYDYTLSPDFLEKYEKELPHSLSYYMNDYQFYRNRKKNYF